MSTTRPEGRRERRGLGLRARGAVAFAVLALMLSASLALLTYQIARSYLLGQRERFALRQAYLNANATNDLLRASDPDLAEGIASLPTSREGFVVLRLGEEWLSAAVAAGRDALPASLVEATEAGHAARQRAVVDGRPVLAVGIPLQDGDATFFEVLPYVELEGTLSTLGWSLFAGASITTVLGAGVGSYASRRVLRPLRRFGAGASSIARGDLGTRLAAPGDTDLAPIATSFNDMAEALQLRLEREARFASDVTHELRTPLTALSAAVDVLERRADERTQPAVDVLRAQVRHFEQLVLDLLEISRFDVGAAELSAEEVPTRDFFGSLLGGLGHAHVPLDLDGTPATFRLDKRRVERVLANLLENAQRYAGGATRVEVSGRPGLLRVAVEDGGPGVPADERTSVFERFHRSRAVSADGERGTGLGLALVAEHAALHGGRAWVEDCTPRGARFVVELAEPPA
jgi:signal transduction histidine kinase